MNPPESLTLQVRPKRIKFRKAQITDLFQSKRVADDTTAVLSGHSGYCERPRDSTVVGVCVSNTVPCCLQGGVVPSIVAGGARRIVNCDRDIPHVVTTKERYPYVAKTKSGLFSLLLKDADWMLTPPRQQHKPPSRLFYRPPLQALTIPPSPLP